MNARRGVRFGSRGIQRGVSLIEVLVAVLVFGIGLLGLAALIIVSLRSTQTAYLRTQASVLAQGMSNRMRANPAGVWGGNYNGSYPLSSGGSASCSSSTCTPAQLAQQDGQYWSQELAAGLPSAAASIACDAATAGASPDSASLNERPPYGGNCSMSISWTERANGDTSHSSAATQTFVWNFQP
ncbi:type IV pilus modification protein PilV [Frateuria aurantia]|uniref:Type IV pilus modification protein PilV n=1 Tax=Frateuria aurantia (strain ATCC 33424 / DSM 6220 / KCTC 2777 / LMG 1558 / NBRC 3245 / NCIMB 13370) TaxID=767434 RepID=H8L4L8_FRAAD|nr:type IV pilus modification protein PilV [Frateuria aurantia]AFC86573.1 type IV pilus modification protein PilV [Frateuria aurantia DSM 6220]